MRAFVCVCLAGGLLWAGCGVPAGSEGHGPEGQTARAAEPAPTLAEQTQRRPAPAKPPGETPPSAAEPRAEDKPVERSRPAHPPEAEPVPAKLTPAAQQSGPIYGLPLEYHIKVPEVPEQIRGPSLRVPAQKMESPSPKA